MSPDADDRESARRAGRLELFGQRGAVTGKALQIDNGSLNLQVGKGDTSRQFAAGRHGAPTQAIQPLGQGASH